MSATVAPYHPDGTTPRTKKTNGQTAYKLSDQLTGAGAPIHDTQPDGSVNPQPLHTTAKAASRKAKAAYNEVGEDLQYAGATAANAGREIGDAARDAVHGVEDLGRRGLQGAYGAGRSARNATHAGARSRETLARDEQYDNFGVLDKTVYLAARGAKVTAPEVIKNGAQAAVHGTVGWFEALAGIPFTVTRAAVEGASNAVGFGVNLTKSAVDVGVNTVSAVSNYTLDTTLKVVDSAGRLADSAAHAVAPPPLVPYVDATAGLVKRVRQEPIEVARDYVPATVYSTVEGAVRTAASTKDFALYTTHSATNYVTSTSTGVVQGSINRLREGENYLWGQAADNFQLTKSRLFDAVDAVVKTVPGKDLQTVVYGSGGGVRAHAAASGW
ncbi:hypothetical protein HK097_010532 [Rhizophlyctis rosea]|uniref:Uncharacterized protein n=1 Tax=Rhizophlyctis rosea TaxID=64517 RepID=A0AAD5S917_9FUNG|nr:hypothetical protein HK097_010532 [Rhizophlyctis rosea]